MKSRTLIIPLTAAMSCVALPIHHAHACEISPPYQNNRVQVMPSGEVSQSAQIVLNTLGWGPEFVLLDASREVVPTDAYDCKPLTTQYYDDGSHCVVETAEPLAPGDYELRVTDGAREFLEDPSSYDTTFTILPELPPTTTLPTPELSWRVVAYTDREDPPLQPGFPDSCSGISRNPSTAWLKVDASVADLNARGHFELEIERERLEAIEGVTFSSSPPRESWLLDLYDYDSDFTCVNATFVDIYGRRSEPTRSCRPDGCEVRDKNDRRPIDWADVQGCPDWSPGWAERNPPGCGCAQVPASPAGTLPGLALLALGLFGARRLRSPRKSETLM